MSKAMLKTRVLRFANTFANEGFSLDGSFRLKRKLPNLNQFLEFQPGYRELEGKFTCNLCWKNTADGVESIDVYDHMFELGHLSGNVDCWYSHKTKEELEESCKKVALLLNQYGIPFLNSISDLQTMLEKYECIVESGVAQPSTPTSPLLFFGLDQGWKHYNLGFAYKAIGEVVKAQDHLTTVIEKWSDQPIEWVQQRKKRCVDALASLS